MQGRQGQVCEVHRAGHEARLIDGARRSRGAAPDRHFRKTATRRLSAAHLRKQQADGEVFQAFEEAESDWQAIAD